MNGPRILVLCCLMLIAAFVNSAAVPVWTRSYDNSRSNANLQETILNTGNVNKQNFGKLFSRKIVGQSYAQVLYVPNLLMKATGKVHNVIFVATMANNLYAFDADDASREAPLWMNNYGPSLPIDEQAIWWESSPHCAVYTDIEIEVGILSTPVIDTTTNTIYFVAVNKDSHSPYTVHHRLHAVDILSGEERSFSPVVVSGSVPGTGIDNVNGVVTFGSAKQSQRHALSLVDGVVYFGFGSYCSAGPYHGWLFGYSAANLERAFYFCSTPNGEQGAIWHTGNGLVSDAAGFLYVVSTNGYYKEGTDFGNSFMKLDPRKVVQSGPYKGMLPAEGVITHFTPFNWEDLYHYDLDLGTSGPLLIPGTDVVYCCSKFGWCYLVNKDDMGGNDAATNKNLQYFQANKNYVKDPLLYASFRMGVHASPATWSTPAKGRLLYIWPAADRLKAYHFTPSGKLGQVDLSKTEVGLIGSGEREDDPEVLFPGGAISISANGEQAGSGILWASHSLDGNSNRMIRTGVLRAFDASDITKELWSSLQIPCRDRVGFFSKFTPPMVANGKVYLPNFSLAPNKDTEIVVYGLLSDSQKNAKWEFDTCCVRDGCAYANTKCCNGACYDPKEYSCTNKQLCPFGMRSCGGACYSPSTFSCVGGNLQPGPEGPEPTPSPSPSPNPSPSPSPNPSPSPSPTPSPSPSPTPSPIPSPKPSQSVPATSSKPVESSTEERPEDSNSGNSNISMKVILLSLASALLFAYYLNKA